MITDGDAPRDLSRLAVPLHGSLEATGDLFEPYRLGDAHGVAVVPAAAYFRELAACGRPAVAHRSYGMALLRWWFLWAVEVCWDQATRAEARDFCLWIQFSHKPGRSHWRSEYVHRAFRHCTGSPADSVIWDAAALADDDPPS